MGSKTTGEATNADRTPLRRPLAAVAVLLVACTGLLVVAPAASAEVRWGAHFWWAPIHLQEGEPGYFAMRVGNAGDETAGPSTVAIELPAGVTYSGEQDVDSQAQWACTGVGTSTITCPPGPQAVATRAGGQPLYGLAGGILKLGLDVAPGSSGLGEVRITVAGGGAPEPHVETTAMRVATTPAGFGVDPDNLFAGAVDDTGEEYTLAGGHPNTARASFRFPTRPEPNAHSLFIDGFLEGKGLADLVTTLPPGFVGDATTMAQCTMEQFHSVRGCPPESQVGVVHINIWQLPNYQTSGVFNMVPPPGAPVRFGFQPALAAPVMVDASVRADGDYGVTLSVEQFHEGDVVTDSRLVIWGNPHDPAHDIQRCIYPNAWALECNGRKADGEKLDRDDVDRSLGAKLGSESVYPRSSSLPDRAFLSMPTNCADRPSTSFLLSTYQNRPEDRTDIDDPRWHRFSVEHPKPTDCEGVPFDPTMGFEPTTKAADSPTGLDVHLNIPRENDSDPDGRVQAHLKKTTVTLPEGVALNASAAQGLAGCAPEQIGLRSAPGEEPIRFNNVEPSCPKASKIANAKVVTPVLDRDLRGEVFLAAQDENPFASTYALYAVIREPSIRVKLAGEVEADPETGQLTTTFDENPQLPFSDLTFDFFGGRHAPLATPKTCGGSTVNTEFVPWSAADPDNPTASEVVSHDDRFEVDRGANGGRCVSSQSRLPFDLGFSAGSHDPRAGAVTPYSMRITRPDGHQDLDRLEIDMPPGVVADLSGIPYCSEAQIAAIERRSGRAERGASACPRDSEIGETLAGSGAGSAPLYVPGKLYLAGPYKGAPLSVVSVTSAVAGPFDLGNVVVRSALDVDPGTAEVTARTDSIPQIMEGAPLRVRDIRIHLNRESFSRNPTNCSELATRVRALGANGGRDLSAERFQVRGCAELQFRPRFRAEILNKGRRSTLRSFNPTMRFTVAPRLGDANLGPTQVTLPSSIILDQSNIKTVCTRPQFAARKCPQRSIYGYAKAWSPLLDEPVEGPVYMGSSSNPLPDIIADLDGQVRVVLQGQVVGVRGGRIQNRFSVVPDAPVTRFEMRMFGGSERGLLVNSTDLCRSRERAVANFHAHNGRQHAFRPPIVLGFKGCRQVLRKEARQAQIRRKKVIRAFKRGQITRAQAKRILRRMKSNRVTSAEARRAIRR